MGATARSFAALAGLVVVLAPTTAGAHGDWGADDAPSVSAPIAEGLVGPLSFAVTSTGTIYVGQSFIGVVTRIDGTATTDVAAVPGASVGAVSVDRSGKNVVFATRSGEPGSEPSAADLYRTRRGSTTLVADLLAYEAAANPDQINTYGFTSITFDCAAQLPAEIGPPTYAGQIDSNPYASVQAHGTTYVADAGGNAIVAVTRRGTVSTVAVLPPQPLEVTTEIAAAAGLPACTVGLTYNVEPVPTDVEVGGDGWLCVTTLPGGPEDPSLPARGGVWKVNPRTGAVAQLAGSLAGATDLAIGGHGRIFVTELFAGRVSVVDRHGNVGTVVELPEPAAIEYARRQLYVACGVFSNGTIATIDV